MEKGRYKKVEKLAEEIIAMWEKGKTSQETVDCLEVEKVQIKNWIKCPPCQDGETAMTTPLRLNLHIFLPGALFCAVPTIWSGALFIAP